MMNELTNDDNVKLIGGVINLKNVTKSTTSSSGNFTSYNINNDDDEIDIYEISPLIAVILSVIYMSVSLCAILGNWMVLWIVIRSKNMRSVTNLFISNIAISDITIGAFAIPFQFQAALLQKWLLPHFLCPFCPTVQIVSLNVSTFTLVALSYDRHRAITSPLKPRLSRTIAFIINGFIWFISLILAIPTFMAYEIDWDEISIEDEIGKRREFVPKCLSKGLPQSFFKPYNHMLVFFQYLVPFFAISFFYIHMAIVLFSNLRISGDSRLGSSPSISSKKRVIKMLLIVIAIFAICWLPFQLYNILQEIFPKINQYHYINLIWFSCHLLAMSNSCINPFIYAIYGEKFNYELTQRFACCCFWAGRFTRSVKNPRMRTGQNVLTETSASSALIRTNKNRNSPAELSTNTTHNMTNEIKSSTSI